jgi:hypothetical protein
MNDKQRSKVKQDLTWGGDSLCQHQSHAVCRLPNFLPTSHQQMQQWHVGSPGEGLSAWATGRENSATGCMYTIPLPVSGGYRTSKDWGTMERRRNQTGRTVGGKHATFTAGFQPDAHILGGLHKILLSLKYTYLYFV